MGTEAMQMVRDRVLVATSSRGPAAPLLWDGTCIFSVYSHCTEATSSRSGRPQVQAFPDS